MALSLSDFDCDLDPPSWMPTDKWDDILALSVLPGALDSLCVKMAESSEEWHTWYKEPYPDMVPLPGQAEAGKTSVWFFNKYTNLEAHI